MDVLCTGVVIGERVVVGITATNPQIRSKVRGVLGVEEPPLNLSLYVLAILNSWHITYYPKAS